MSPFSPEKNILGLTVAQNHFVFRKNVVLLPIQNHIPCHPEFVMEKVVLNKDFTKDFIKDFIKEKRMQISERQEKILFMIFDDDTITSQKIAQKTGVSQRTILKDLNKLQTTGILARDGGRKDGTWVIVTA